MSLLWFVALSEPHAKLWLNYKGVGLDYQPLLGKWAHASSPRSCQDAWLCYRKSSIKPPGECVSAEFLSLAKTKGTKRQKCLLSDDICHFLRLETLHKVKFEFTSATRSVRHSRVQQCLLELMGWGGGGGGWAIVGGDPGFTRGSGGNRANYARDLAVL